MTKKTFSKLESKILSGAVGTGVAAIGLQAVIGTYVALKPLAADLQETCGELGYQLIQKGVPAVTAAVFVGLAYLAVNTTYNMLRNAGEGN